MRIVWTPRSLIHLTRISDYLREHDRHAADRIVSDIEQGVSGLFDFPLRGRIGRAARTRELVIARSNYVVAYRLEPNRILVLAVMHGAQLWPSRF